MHTLVKYTLARRLYRDIVRGFDLLMPLGFLSGPSFLLLSFRFGFEDEEARKRLLGPFGLWHLPALDDSIMLGISHAIRRYLVEALVRICPFSFLFLLFLADLMGCTAVLAVFSILYS